MTAAQALSLVNEASVVWGEPSHEAVQRGLAVNLAAVRWHLLECEGVLFVMEDSQREMSRSWITHHWCQFWDRLLAVELRVTGTSIPAGA